jgi:hypothetical protein
VRSGRVRTTRTEGGHHRVAEAEVDRLLARQQPAARGRVTAAADDESLGGLSARNYVYLVPFVEDEHTVFLKAIIPSRKATREYPVGSPTMKIDADEKELLESVPSTHDSQSAIVRTGIRTVKRGRPRDYLSIVDAIGLTPFRRTLGHAASRCVSFE